MKIVLYCSVLVYAAVTEYAVVMERGIRESEPSFGDMYCNL